MLYYLHMEDYKVNKAMHAKLKDIAEIKFSLVSETKENSTEESKWLTATNLLDGNRINRILLEDSYKKDESLIVKPQDIIIKRISPSFINYIDTIEDEVHAYNNLILIKANERVYPKYLACILNEKIKRLAVTTGTTSTSIGRSELENLTIILPPFDGQVKIGEIWYGGLKLKDLKQRLAELENIKYKYFIEQYINKQMGVGK